MYLFGIFLESVLSVSPFVCPSSLSVWYLFGISLVSVWYLNQPVNGTKLLTKCPKNEAQSGAERLKMLQNRGLEGCCAALGGLLGHLGVGGASGEAS